MPEAEAAGAAGHAAKGGADFLKKKVGPLPLVVWLVAAAAIYWYMSKKNTSTGQQTDPAGNVGTIDPNTGYVTGSAEDLASLRGVNSGSGSDTSTDNSSGSTTAGQYADNNAWAQAAINYLVARGVDPTQANEAVQQYLASQQLTSAQQADVNLAIQGIGAPPTLPGAVGVAPKPIVTPPTNTTVYATNPPSGLRVVSRGQHSVKLSWNATTNATGYTLSWGKVGTSVTNSSASVTSPGAQAGNLNPNTNYWFHVQATPAKSGAPYASVNASTLKS